MNSVCIIFIVFNYCEFRDCVEVMVIDKVYCVNEVIDYIDGEVVMLFVDVFIVIYNLGWWVEEF